MPELPEVETMRRGVLPIVGRRIADVRRADCACRPIAVSPRIDRFRARTVGKIIDAIDRVGKRVVVRLGGGDAIVFEPRMTGLVLVADPPDVDYLRLRIALERPKPGAPKSNGQTSKRQPTNGRGIATELLFWDRRGLGRVHLLSPDEFSTRLGPTRLGPDALAVTSDQLRRRLGASRRPIKVALLDQRAIAGIGNLYASEILHLARIHPQLPCNRLAASAWAVLRQCTLDVLEAAIRHEGSTLSDGTYRNALSQQGSYQNYHRVYDRAGETCPTCHAAAIVRIVQAQRSTFYCPNCQPAGRRIRRASPIRTACSS